MDASLSSLFRKIGVKSMEPKELTSGILLESVLECTSFVVNEVPNLYSAVIERLNQDDKIFFMNFVEDEDGQDDYYGYVYNKTNGKIYEYAFHDDKLVKNRKLSFIEKKIGELTTKDILELPIIDLLNLDIPMIGLVLLCKQVVERLRLYETSILDVDLCVEFARGFRYLDDLKTFFELI